MCLDSEQLCFRVGGDVSFVSLASKLQKQKRRLYSLQSLKPEKETKWLSLTWHLDMMRHGRDKTWHKTYLIVECWNEFFQARAWSYIVTSNCNSLFYHHGVTSLQYAASKPTLLLPLTWCICSLLHHTASVLAVTQWLQPCLKWHELALPVGLEELCHQALPSRKNFPRKKSWTSARFLPSAQILKSPWTSKFLSSCLPQTTCETVSAVVQSQFAIRRACSTKNLWSCVPSQSSNAKQPKNTLPTPWLEFCSLRCRLFNIFFTLNLTVSRGLTWSCWRWIFRRRTWGTWRAWLGFWTIGCRRWWWWPLWWWWWCHLHIHFHWPLWVCPLFFSHHCHWPAETFELPTAMLGPRSASLQTQKPSQTHVGPLRTKRNHLQGPWMSSQVHVDACLLLRAPWCLDTSSSCKVASTCWNESTLRATTEAAAEAIDP